ncbi:oocyte-expressed protein homolog isoform X2 [Mesocricetus auratus]|uniref:Oocyte-expressed protein homolog isoform X2 n=1 Tax=Mesocricetus auratus TaxID=10036 RepID=A0A3Q0CWB1_MESAU|nr:oocyte-expressed protein homolog isoform X2 [Mesocricetus auratus]
MGLHTTEHHAEQKSQMRNRPSKKLLSAPPASPRLHVRPWWFPVHELSDPVVMYLDAWLAEIIFGPNQALISEIEWISQALVRVDTIDSGNLAEITIFGRPFVKNRLKNIILNLAVWHKEQHAQKVSKHQATGESLGSISEETLENGRTGQTHPDPSPAAQP